MSSKISPVFYRSVAGINANGTGVVIDMTAAPKSRFTMNVIRTAGATDTVSIALEGSLDNSNWIALGSITDVTSGKATTSVVDKPARHLRYNVVTVGAGNTHMIQLLAA